jgi:hypothetical protein
MKTFAGAVLGCALLWGASSGAQEPGRGRGAFPAHGPGPGRGVDLLAVEPLDLAEPVLDIPYSAATMTEVVQRFADGNRVEQHTSGSIARDSAGRIRREQTLAGLGGPASGGETRIVTIIWPAERVQYRLDEAQRIAWRLRLPPPPDRGAFAGRGAFPRPPGLKTEPLAAMQFEGFKAEGTRTVLVLPVGSIGNERSIEVINERWFAPDLQSVVQTRRVDPRFGEVTYRLVNIARAEPPSYLFEVPADYTVREQRPFWPAPR